MAKDVKIVKSKTAPVDKNVLWDDGENLKIYRNGVWENTNKGDAGLDIANLLEALKPVRLSGELPVGNVTQEQLDEIGLTEKVITCICDGYTRTIINCGIPYSVIQACGGDFNNYEIIIANYLFDDSGDIYGLSQYRIECMEGVCKIYLTDI